MANSSSTPTSSSGSAIPTGITDCPGSNNTIYVSQTTSGSDGIYSFRKLCGYDHAGGKSINMEAFVPSFDACIAMCSNMNVLNSQGGLEEVCRTVSFNPAGTMPGNCWASDETDIVESENGISIGLFVG